MASVDKQIEEYIKSNKKGTVLFPEDFTQYGSSGAVRLALHRLVEKGELTRVAQGVYVRPKQSKLVGETLPSTEEVAKAIAKRDRARIIPTGAYALHALGLSTQIPMKIVYLTDGSPRTIRVGNRTILFKKTTPKNLSMLGEINGLVIQALKAIGNGKVLKEEEEKVIELIQKGDKNILIHDIKLAPAWIADIMKKGLDGYRA